MSSRRFYAVTTLLALLSLCELLFNLFLLIYINTVLYHGGGQTTTVISLIASLLSLPTSFKLKMGERHGEELRGHHIEIQKYLVYMLLICLAAHCLDILLCLIGYLRYSAIQSSYMESMVIYNKNINKKQFIDYVQLMLQCCGATSYEDWLRINWMNCRQPRKVRYLLAYFRNNNRTKMDTLPPKINNAVPYSCCVLHTSEPCNHNNLVQWNTNSINTNGCGVELANFVMSLVTTQLLVAIVIVVIIVILIRLLTPIVEKPLNNESGTEDDEAENTDDWEHFTNSLSAGSAELAPSSHSEKMVALR